MSTPSRPALGTKFAVVTEGKGHHFKAGTIVTVAESGLHYTSDDAFDVVDEHGLYQELFPSDVVPYCEV